MTPALGIRHTRLPHTLPRIPRHGVVKAQRLIDDSAQVPVQQALEILVRGPFGGGPGPEDVVEVLLEEGLGGRVQGEEEEDEGEGGGGGVEAGHDVEEHVAEDFGFGEGVVGFWGVVLVGGVLGVGVGVVCFFCGGVVGAGDDEGFCDMWWLVNSFFFFFSDTLGLCGCSSRSIILRDVEASRTTYQGNKAPLPSPPFPAAPAPNLASQAYTASTPDTPDTLPDAP